MSLQDTLRFPTDVDADRSCATRPRIYVDCTQTLARPVATGIPRVWRRSPAAGAAPCGGSFRAGMGRRSRRSIATNRGRSSA
ncbi:hypothetical protein EBR04_10450, partial [bacterium]|nr:hypothetical protein [bacterium]